MARYRRRSPRKSSSAELVCAIAALLFAGIYFSPDFRRLLVGLLILILIAAILALIGWIAYRKWRKRADAPGQTGAIAAVAPSNQQAADASATPPLMRPAPQRLLEWSPVLLSRLEWKRFEDVVAAYIRVIGHQARTTRIGPDGGVDVEVLDPATGQVVMLVQCKAWDAYKVGIKPLRELFGVMAAAKITQGAFFTTGEYTQDALVFARENQLDAVDGAEFISRIRQLSAASQLRLLEAATQGDYTTPTCPGCGVKMILRTAEKGRNTGDSFWGCRNYPRCKQTFRLPKAA
ncbi:MAG: restriction endonuclease [Opitutae bacterium]|nr:restriction endonuclease [Opitutae bacterium]